MPRFMTEQTNTSAIPTHCTCGGTATVNTGLTVTYASCDRSGFHIWNSATGFEDRCPYSRGTAKTRTAYLYAMRGADGGVS